MKQTAVEWFYNNLKSHFEHDGDLLEAVQMSFQQAKAMEKEQIVDAWGAGYDEEDRATSNPFSYYNETFNTNEK